MKSVCVVAIYTVLILKLLSCWSSMYCNINILVSNFKIIKGNKIFFKYLTKLAVL